MDIFTHKGKNLIMYQVGDDFYPFSLSACFSVETEQSLIDGCYLSCDWKTPYMRLTSVSKAAEMIKEARRKVYGLMA